jgi:hypothetical protein
MTDAPLSDLLDAAAAYLHDSGIHPTVIGGVTVQHQPGERQHNHELVVRFTAVLPDYLPNHAPEVVS